MFENNQQDGSVGPGTVVGANVKLKGTISDVNDITIHGTVEGEVISDKVVTISETATVKGPVTAQIVSVSGNVDGAIIAHQKLELLPAGQIKGSITAAELIIKSGALFNGKCSMAKNGVSVEPATDLDDSASSSELKEASSKKTSVKKQDEMTLPQESIPATPTFELED